MIVRFQIVEDFKQEGLRNNNSSLTVYNCTAAPRVIIITYYPEIYQINLNLLQAWFPLFVVQYVRDCFRNP